MPDLGGLETSQCQLEIELGVEVRGVGTNRGPKGGGRELVCGFPGAERLEDSEEVVRL
jgi:hypothetical protein